MHGGGGGGGSSSDGCRGCGQYGENVLHGAHSPLNAGCHKHGCNTAPETTACNCCGPGKYNALVLPGRPGARGLGNSCALLMMMFLVGCCAHCVCWLQRRHFIGLWGARSGHRSKRSGDRYRETREIRRPQLYSVFAAPTVFKFACGQWESNRGLSF